MKKVQQQGYFQQWWQIVTRPHEIFAQIKTKDYKTPTVFYLKTYALSLAFLYLILVPLGMFFAFIFANIMQESTELYALVVILLALIAYPFLVLWSWAVIHITSGIYHIFALMFGAKQPYQQTYTVTCYASAPILVAAIPIIGSVAGIYTLVLQVFGLKEKQKLSTGKAVWTVVLPVLISIFFTILLYMSLFVFGVI